MPFLDDIWITLAPRDVFEFDQSAQRKYSEEEIQKAIEVFHRDREAKAAYEILPLDKSPLPLSLDQTGIIAVAATLGLKFQDPAGLPGLEACLKTALAQLQAYINYRIAKRLSPKKLHLGWPLVPGGAAAPNLTHEQVLTLLPDNESGVEIRQGRPYPAWSLIFLYPLGPKPDQTSACASCGKDCSLRK